MQRLMLVLCTLILGAGLVVAGALPAGAQAVLQGNWVATAAETDGAPSPGVVGHRLSLSGDRFAIRSNRPAAFESKSGSGYVLVTFVRAK